MLRTLFWRFALPALVVTGLAAWGAVPLAERMLAGWLRADVEQRARLLVASIEEPLAEQLDRPAPERLRRWFARVAVDERLLGLLLCAPDGRAVLRGERVPAPIDCPAEGAGPEAAGPAGAGRATVEPGAAGPGRFPGNAPAGGAGPPAATSGVVVLAPAGGDGGPVLVTGVDVVPRRGGAAWRLLVVHDLRFADRRSSGLRDGLVAFAAVAGIAVALGSALAAWALLRGWTRSLVRDIRTRRFQPGAADAAPVPGSTEVLLQVRRALRELERSRTLELDYSEHWTPEALAHVVTERLASPRMVVVSNREPVVHERRADGGIAVRVGAGGVVTALEPVVRACAGTWIATGSGSADRDVVDADDRIRVPPDDPSYTLRRIWLSSEEESAYYDGFANGGLWPLCHLAWVRPVFRAEDWAGYEAVNRRFAEAVVQEGGGEAPVVFVQDYHFARLPLHVRERVPGATIVLFWHIPWPAAETFGVCPWKEALLSGLLAADILGFHTRGHCANFLETVDRTLECQIDHERMTVTVRGHVCRVAPYPISIEWPPRALRGLPDPAACAAAVRARLGVADDVALAVGVERWDFTKGIVERIEAFETAFERWPALRGRVTLVQVAEPSRTRLPAYQALQDETRAAVDRVNGRWGDARWRPVILIDEHLEPRQVHELYRAAAVCLVTSLHDGMNLVAKEFVAARDDEDGVLILSAFAGASSELLEAVPVNPFDRVDTAAAIRLALSMGRDERRERMRMMRRTVQHSNVYRWAGRMLMDAAELRQRQRLQAGGRP